MRNILYLIKYFVLVCFLIIFNFSFAFNCKSSQGRRNSAEQGSRTEKIDGGELKIFAYPNKNSKSKQSALKSTYSADYTPLTLEILTSVLGNNQEFSYISILYSKSFNLTPESHSKDHLSFSLDTGQAGTSNIYNSIVNYDSSLSKEFQTTNPPVSDYYEINFTVAEVQMIFDYILDPEHPERQTYFFSGEEYTGHNIPYKSPGVHICAGYQAFTLAIYEPNRQTDAWAISKCGFGEPDPILQGLINIIETNFISQFEEP